jgi:hypothetical protein
MDGYAVLTVQGAKQSLVGPGLFVARMGEENQDILHAARGPFNAG